MKKTFALMTLLFLLFCHQMTPAAYASDKGKSISEKILDAAEFTFIVNPLPSTAFSWLKSMLGDIFGSGSPDFVNLSEQSLKRIQQIIRKEITEAFEDHARAELNESLDELKRNLDYYYRSVDSSTPHQIDLMLEGLRHDSSEVLSSKAFMRDYPPFSNGWFFMAEIYALAASLRVAVLGEVVTQNLQDPDIILRPEEEEMYLKLNEMINALNSHIRKVVKLRNPPCNDPRDRNCLYVVTDGFARKTYKYRLNQEAQAVAKYRQLVYHYMGKLPGNGTLNSLYTLRRMAYNY